LLFRFNKAKVRLAGTALLLSLLSGCVGFFPADGPSRKQVHEAAQGPDQSPIQIVDVTDAVARRVLASQRQSLFSETLGLPGAPVYTVGPGDVLGVSVWEAPPASLFGSTSMSQSGGLTTSQVTNFPEEMVDSEGTISVPFAGNVPVAGLEPPQIEAEIARRLKGKANQPQVMVRVVKNVTSNVTVVGEVTASTRMPLTAKGERLLDALAAAGGVRQPVNKMTLQITRGNQVRALPLETIIEDPHQNVILAPGDVVTALYQPLSFTLLGAAGHNEEVNFEAQGISLAQALARAGGVRDDIGDPRGVFVFRFEDPAALDLHGKTPLTTPEGKVPVVYEVDLKDPRTFFVAQSFPVRNRDVIYVSNAPSAELQKFLNVVTSVVYSVVNLPTITNATK